MPDKPPIGVIGVGWVGLVSAACFAELGHDVWCRDIDATKVESLRNGHVPIYEPDLADVVARNAGRLHFELELGPLMEHARLLFVCVDTPPTYSGDADLSRVEAVIEELPSSAEHAIVMKSTVPVGTGANVVRRLGELGKGELGYASNPEFLKEGSAVADFMKPDRVVVGADTRTPWAAAEVARLYEPIGCAVVTTDVASAEMIKLASNAFLATKISFINEIANVCEEVGADVGEVAAGMGLDPRIGGSFLNAGVGFGGSCFPKDVSALKQLAGNSGYHFQLLTAVIEVNELQKRRVVSKLKKHLGSSLVGKKVALLGLAFKPHTDDMREASSVVLAARLQGEGAIVSAYDPVAEERASEMLTGVKMCDSALDAVDGTDAAVIVTEWPEFADLDLGQVSGRMANPVIVDGRNMLDPKAVRAAGFVYEGIGRT
jgi:UDPglucose 6-dehydrogenase